MSQQQKKILFLEDEPTIREVLKEYMLLSQYQVDEVDNGTKAIEYLDKGTYDLAVLDIMVPGKSGLEVLSYIKDHYPKMGTIMLTALEDEKTQVDAFNRYADDYVIKPVSPIIILKRMETILRRLSVNINEEVFETGLSFKEESYLAYYYGALLPLTLSEYLLLHTLYKEPNRVFNREQLILRIFNDDYIGNDRIIDAHIKNIRKKLPVYSFSMIGI